MKLKEKHRNLAILPLCWKSRALGPQLASRRQRGDFGIVGVGLWLNCISSRVLTKFEEMQQNLAIMSLH